jgi:hypothetical protein
MLGPDWLIAPVTAENATSWPAYLPKIPPVPTGTPGEKSHEWVSLRVQACRNALAQRAPERACLYSVLCLTSRAQVYWWNQSVVQEGQWVTVDTTALKDFPLFYKRPL